MHLCGHEWGIIAFYDLIRRLVRRALTAHQNITIKATIDFYKPFIFIALIIASISIIIL